MYLPSQRRVKSLSFTESAVRMNTLPQVGTPCSRDAGSIVARLINLAREVNRVFFDPPAVYVIHSGSFPRSFSPTRQTRIVCWPQEKHVLCLNVVIPGDSRCGHCGGHCSGGHCSGGEKLYCDLQHGRSATSGSEHCSH